MLTPPADLSEAALEQALAEGWGISVTAARYRAVGWGSHHWDVTSAPGARWFVTVDELENKRLSRREPLAAGFRRLRAALAAATDLRDVGAAFVVAPVPADDGEPLARVGDRFAAAVYPFIDGQSFEWGEFSSPEHRRGVLGLVAAVHSAPAAARRRALADDFAVPHRDELEAACDPGGEPPGCGPYARPAWLLVQRHAAPLRRLLDRYDHLVRQARARPDLLSLYRLRWDIAEIAVDVGRFRRPHTGTADDSQSWELLSSAIGQACPGAGSAGPLRQADPDINAG